MNSDQFDDRFKLQASVVVNSEKVEMAIDTIFNLLDVKDMSKIFEIVCNQAECKEVIILLLILRRIEANLKNIIIVSGPYGRAKYNR
jgi:hypothetical protein